MTLEFLNDYDFFTGVPDSLLQPLCNYLMKRYGANNKHHVIAANEGNCVALAAGHYLATGKVPVVYLQNSGLGNIVNPVASLLNDKVYGIPCIFFVGWRGEPNVHDEPQHVFQGEITVKLLEDMDIATCVISKETAEEEVRERLRAWEPLLKAGKQVAFVVKKGALSFDGKMTYQNGNAMLREEIIRRIAKAAGDDPIVCTTGKASRELFELREEAHGGHGRDFLTVGSMGHSSSIALKIAMEKKSRVWCIDGDGAALMHMGSMAVIGTSGAENFVHIVVNNGAHESVGGLPTVASKIDLCKIAEGCGYRLVLRARTFQELEEGLSRCGKEKGPVFLEVECAIGARENLGRPTTSAQENKSAFMEHLKKLS